MCKGFWIISFYCPIVKVQERYEKVEKDVDNYWDHRFSFFFFFVSLENKNT